MANGGLLRCTVIEAEPVSGADPPIVATMHPVLFENLYPAPQSVI